ncbi:MAG: Alpha/beta hydrolase [Candidatus Hydrogenedentes bacterium]|nr:Alpha/beta hydrolase [Candidatus Hydrogenedentota bacterium]
MNRFKRYRVFSVLAGLLLALWLPVSALAVPPPLDEEALLAADTPPPIPPGFKTEDEVMSAILGGKIRVLSPLMNIPIPEGVVEIKDIEYGRVGDRQLLLDLYMPANLDKPTPGLLFIHGGGWEQGQRSDYKYYTVRYAKRGYVVATMSYRFAKEAPFPGCVQDAKCAVRWMRANAEKYHIDPDRIAAIGGSAGGHLAMMLGYSAGVPELEGDGGHAEFSSAVQAVVNYYGPVDLTVPVQRDHPILINFFAGKKYEEAPDQYKLASPITHLDKGDPPTLIFHGTIDELVPIEQADMLAKKLEELGIPYVYERIEGYPHALDVAEAVNIHCQWYINHFLAEHLAKK